jgi:hypothetical protein
MMSLSISKTTENGTITQPHGKRKVQVTTVLDGGICQITLSGSLMIDILNRSQSWWESCLTEENLGSLTRTISETVEGMLTRLVMDFLGSEQT